ncbi:hypothetical protein AJ80_01850 [Polytolypa hystricis UAMH7299]|uniref:Uncharacterized protein n=1 Tax=Polytolypa hystricis (strain UAMH7299) TaxID=1447883 RepID=A0A2B7YXZ0_POLH7|nr:hypothetical protein AJ80_01850 [Polytolypa hystricis UAMH7299]
MKLADKIIVECDNGVATVAVVIITSFPQWDKLEFIKASVNPSLCSRLWVGSGHPRQRSVERSGCGDAAAVFNDVFGLREVKVMVEENKDVFAVHSMFVRKVRRCNRAPD